MARRARFSTLYLTTLIQWMALGVGRREAGIRLTSRRGRGGAPPDSLVAY